MERKRKRTEAGTKIRLRDGTEILLPEADTTDFAETLRNAIRAAGLTQYHLAKLTGVPQSALSRFMAGQDLRVTTFQKLCRVVGLQLTQNEAGAPRKLKGANRRRAP